MESITCLLGAICSLAISALEIVFIATGIRALMKYGFDAIWKRG